MMTTNIVSGRAACSQAAAAGWIHRALPLVAALAAAVQPAFADKTISENLKLTEDLDWSDQGTVTIAEGVTLDLNGYALKVAAVNGAGSIVDSAAAALEGYERLEYLEAKQTGASNGAPGGAKAQFIDTGYRHNAKTDVDIRVAYTAVNSYRVVYGARNTSDNTTQFGVWLNGGKFMRQTCQKTASTPSSGYAATVDTVYDIRISKSGANTVKLKDSDTVLYDLADGNEADGNNTSGNDYLFSMNQSNSSTTQGSWPCACKVWFCKISEDGALKRHFIPVRRQNGSEYEYGMLDLVDGGFYTKGTADSAAFEGPVAVRGLRLAPSAGAAIDFSGLTIGEGVELSFDGQGSLAADLDAFASVEVSSGSVLALDGNTLSAANITGDGAIVDSADNFFAGSDGSIYQKVEFVRAPQLNAYDAMRYDPDMQWVDTGYYHNGTTKVDIRVLFHDTVYTGIGYAAYYGARDNSKYKTSQFGGWLRTGKFFYYDNSTHDGSAANTGVIYDVRLDKGGESYANLEDGTRASTLGTGNGVCESSSYGTDFIFALNQVSDGGESWPCNCQVYSCKIYDKVDADGNAVSDYILQRDFVPVRRISGTNVGEAGFWCTVTKKFYGNSGAGSLVAGPAVESETAGGLCIAAAEGETVSLASSPVIAGNVKVVKSGAGTLAVPVEGLYFTGGIEVAAGTLSMGGALAYGGGISAASGATVEIPADFGSTYSNTITLSGGTFKVSDCGASIVDGVVTLSGGAISVAGSFAPVSGSAAYAVALADGSTLDFSQWTGAFSVASPAISFASGANIALKFTPVSAALTALAKSTDAGTGAKGGYVIGWDSIPDGVSFTGTGSVEGALKVRIDDGGIWAVKFGGTAVMLR